MVDWLTVLATSIPWAAILSLALYFFKNPEKVEKWYSIVARILSYVSSRAELSHIASDIQADINLSAKDINAAAMESVMPYGIKINWAEETTKEAFIADDDVVVRMRYHKNQARNMLYATLGYVEEGLLPYASSQVDNVVLQATRYHTARKILTERNRHSALKIFYDEIYEPEKTQEPLLETYFKKIDSIDKDKLFEPVVLSAFSDLGLEMMGRSPSDKVKKATREFVDFVYTIATKESGVDIPTAFIKDEISAEFFLIGRPMTYLAQGIEPYIHEIKKKHKEGVKTIYLCAKGPTVSATKEISTHLERLGILKKVGEFEQKPSVYRGKTKAIIRIKMKST